MAVPLNVAPADHVFLLFSRWHVFNPDSCWEQSHVPVPLYYKHTFPTGMEIVWFTQKMTQKAWNYMQMNGSIPHFLPSKVWLSNNCMGQFLHQLSNKGHLCVINISLWRAVCHLSQKLSEKTPAIIPKEIIRWLCPSKAAGSSRDIIFTRKTTVSSQENMEQIKKWTHWKQTQNQR